MVLTEFVEENEIACVEHYQNTYTINTLIIDTEEEKLKTSQKYKPILLNQIYNNPQLLLINPVMIFDMKAYQDILYVLMMGGLMVFRKCEMVGAIEMEYEEGIIVSRKEHQVDLFI